MQDALCLRDAEVAELSAQAEALSNELHAEIRRMQGLNGGLVARVKELEREAQEKQALSEELTSLRKSHSTLATEREEQEKLVKEEKSRLRAKLNVQLKSYFTSYVAQNSKVV